MPHEIACMLVDYQQQANSEQWLYNAVRMRWTGRKFRAPDLARGSRDEVFRGANNLFAVCKGDIVL